MYARHQESGVLRIFPDKWNHGYVRALDIKHGSGDGTRTADVIPPGSQSSRSPGILADAHEPDIWCYSRLLWSIKELILAAWFPILSNHNRSLSISQLNSHHVSTLPSSRRIPPYHLPHPTNRTLREIPTHPRRRWWCDRPNKHLGSSRPRLQSNNHSQRLANIHLQSLNDISNRRCLMGTSPSCLWSAQ